MADIANTRDFNALNNDVRSWTRTSRRELKAAVSRLSSKGKGELMRNLRYSVKKRSGVVQRSVFKFPRHGVFFQKGVGKGWPISKVKGAVNPARKPKPWFNETIEERIPELADLVQKHYADLTVRNIKIS